MNFVIFATFLLVCSSLSTNANVISFPSIFESTGLYKELRDTDRITHKELCMEKIFHDGTYCYIFKIRGIEKIIVSPVKVILNKRDTIEELSKLDDDNVLVTVHIKTGNGISAPNDKETIRALKWIRDNISSFGGDSSNVTLCYYPEDRSRAIHIKEHLNENLAYNVVTINTYSPKEFRNVEREITSKENISTASSANAYISDYYNLRNTKTTLIPHSSGNFYNNNNQINNQELRNY